MLICSTTQVHIFITSAKLCHHVDMTGEATHIRYISPHHLSYLFPIHPPISRTLYCLLRRHHATSIRYCPNSTISLRLYPLMHGVGRLDYVPLFKKNPPCHHCMPCYSHHDLTLAPCTSYWPRYFHARCPYGPTPSKGCCSSTAPLP